MNKIYTNFKSSELLKSTLRTYFIRFCRIKVKPENLKVYLKESKLSCNVEFKRFLVYYSECFEKLF